MPKMPKSKPEPEKQKPARNTRQATMTTRSANPSTVTKKPSTPAKQKSVLLELNCIVEGESSSFPVKILSTEKISVLKNTIKVAKAPQFGGFAPYRLTLRLIPGGATKEELSDFPISSLKELDNELERLSTYFPDGATESLIHIIVKPPQQAPKRSHEADELRSPSKKVKIGSDPIFEAIEAAGLTEKTVVNGKVDLSLLTKKELTSVLDNIGVKASRTNEYDALSQTAAILRNLSFQDMDLISSSPRTRLPVIAMRDLYVRQDYKDLYDIIKEEFGGPVDVEEDENHVVVTGTAGIGKSAFLVYFIIRILATSSEDDPPVIVFQEKESTACYAFGGLYTVRSGNLQDFKPFLELPETWYLVDSSPEPLLPIAKTIISVSPKTLHSDNNLYHNIDERISWCYCMSPWTLEELELCRTKVRAFEKVPRSLLEELYDKIGGVPRYVLERPKKELARKPRNIAGARRKAYERVKAALFNVDDPMTLMQYFEQREDSLKDSSHLLHRWPTQDHEGFRLEWASKHIAEEVLKLTTDTAWQLILARLVSGKTGEAKGPIFEIYARHLFRQGNWRFQARSLQGDSEITIALPANPPVIHFDQIEAAAPGTLYIPNSQNFACVDMLLAPNCLLQVTLNKEHGIKSEKFEKLLESLVNNNWIGSYEEAQMIFVVPQDIYNECKKQHYLTKTNTVNTKVPQELKYVKQYVLGIDLRAASTGGSPVVEMTSNLS